MIRFRTAASEAVEGHLTACAADAANRLDGEYNDFSDDIDEAFRYTAFMSIVAFSREPSKTS
jgi:hypothetical protein